MEEKSPSMSDSSVLARAVARAGETGGAAGTGADGASAASELLPLVYADLRALAQRRLAGLPPGQTIQPTALVHEAYLRVCRHGDVGFNGRAHFFRSAARAMRDVLVDHARAKFSQKRGPGARAISLDDEHAGFESSAEEVLAVADALQSLAKESERAAEVVTMRFFGGFPPELVAEVLETSVRTVEREWRYSRAWLRRELLGEAAG